MIQDLHRQVPLFPSALCRSGVWVYKVFTSAVAADIVQIAIPRGLTIEAVYSIDGSACGCAVNRSEDRIAKRPGELRVQLTRYVPVGNNEENAGCLSLATRMSETKTDDPRDAFLEACVWHGSLAAAEAILAAHPEIGSSDIHTAAILGDDTAVRRFLALDPGCATAKGGPRDWDALTYLSFSKYLRLDPARSDGFLRAATALLDAGASANTGFFEENHQPKPEWESVLYGAAGVAHHPEMTRLLLERGADPNDGEVAYHSPETLDNRALKILVESGKLTPYSIVTMLIRKFDWHDDDGVAWLLDHGADPNLLTHWGGRPMHHALSRGNPLAYFELLLDHGADPTLGAKDGTTPFAIAARMARADVLDLFERRGFAVTLDGDDAFLAACARADEGGARRIVAADPAVVKRLQSQNSGLLVDFAGSGNTAAVCLMLDLGFDIGSQRTSPRWEQGVTALHAACRRGHLEMVKLLIERGAPLEATHRSGATPLAVALQSLVEQSEWTPNEYSLPIAKALLSAGARIASIKLTLAAAICLERMDDVARLLPEASAEDRHIALEAAAFNGITQAIGMLIRLGVDVNAYNINVQYHATPLHNAVCSGSFEAVKKLVEAGAKVDAKDTAYQATPLTWAEYYLRGGTSGNPAKQYAAIVDYLREKGRNE
jgi:ankyrin repeat protein